MALPSADAPRLVLELPSPADAPAVVDYFARNRAHLERWEPARPPGFYDTPFWHERLTLSRREAADGRSLRFFVRLREEPGRFVGCVNLSDISRGCFLSAFLGYSLDRALEGQGYMHEALSAALPVAFAHLRLHRIAANYQPSNERSGRLLRRLGFAVEGYARDYLFIDGAWRDHVLTALVKPGIEP